MSHLRSILRLFLISLAVVTPNQARSAFGMPGLTRGSAAVIAIIIANGIRHDKKTQKKCFIFTGCMAASILTTLSSSMAAVDQSRQAELALKYLNTAFVVAGLTVPLWPEEYL